MTHDLELFAAGTPVPQGSMSGFPIKGTRRVNIVPSNKKALDAWRATIETAAFNAIAEQGYTPADGPLRADMTFYFDRPQYHFGSGANARRLKPNAPTYVDVKPDSDKLVRAAFDAFTRATVWADDARCVQFQVTQLYIHPGQSPGMLARIRPVAVDVQLPVLGVPREEWETVPGQVDPPSLFDD